MESHQKTTEPGANPGSIRALIVDDETGAINTLRGMLGQYCPNVTVAGAATAVKEAVDAAQALKPDLVFLDIEMPPVGSGFDFIKNCPEISFGVIFTTAYPQYAIRAINTIQPWAYLVKPYSVSELRAAVDIAFGKIKQLRWSMLQSAFQHSLLISDSRKGNIVLRAGDVVYCKADGSFTDIFLLKNNKLEKIKSSRNLGEFEAELPEALFCRTHHGYLVNLSYIDRFERTGRNGLIHLSCTSAPVEISVSKMELFAQQMDQFMQLSAYRGGSESL